MSILWYYVINEEDICTEVVGSAVTSPTFKAVCFPEFQDTSILNSRLVNNNEDLRPIEWNGVIWVDVIGASDVNIAANSGVLING